MSLQGWQALACPKCGGKRFMPMFEMIWQNGLGTSQRPVGHICVGCHEPVDTVKMIAHAKKTEAEIKIKDLEASIGG